MQIVDHTKNIIQASHVSFSYGSNEVLRDITLNIHQGDYVGVIGANGAGKTTLLKIMLGLLTPSSGSISLFGQDIKYFKDWSKIGYVPQKATNFDVNFPATVEEVVLMGRFGKRGLFHRAKPEDREAVEKALKQVDMIDYRKRLIGDLSGGQQQRIFIARALVSDPEVIFLDEPTSGVDRNTQDEFYPLLKKLNRELGITLVLISHDIEKILEEVMHIACIDCTLVSHNSPEEYMKEIETKKIAGKEVQLITRHHHH